MGDFALAALGGASQGFSQGQLQHAEQQRRAKQLKLQQGIAKSNIELQAITAELRQAQAEKLRQPPEPKILSPSDLGKLRGPQGGTLPFGTTEKQAAQGGAVPGISEGLFQQQLRFQREEGLSAALLKQRLPIEPSPGERKEATQREASVKQVDRLREIFDDKKVGPIEGRKLQFRAFTGRNLTKKDAEFFSLTRAVENRVIREITGAQLSEAEATRILGQVPQMTDPPILWRAKWKETKKNLQELIALQKRQLRQKGQKRFQVLD